MAEIKLTQGKVAIADDSDFEYLNQFKWHAACPDDKWYARRALPHAPGGKQKHITMQDDLLGKPPKGMEIDHKDGNGLNNKRDNIRVCTHHQNLMNKAGHGETSKFKGVTRRKGMNKYRASIGFFGKVIHLGYFKKEEDAAIAYNNAALKYFGDFAKLNEVRL